MDAKRGGSIPFFNKKVLRQAERILLNRYFWLFRIKLSCILVFVWLYDLTAILLVAKPHLVDRIWLLRHFDFQPSVLCMLFVLGLAVNFPYPGLLQLVTRWHCHNPIATKQRLVHLSGMVDLALLTGISFCCGRENALFSFNVFIFIIALGAFVYTYKTGFFLACYSSIAFGILSLGEHWGCISSLEPCIGLAIEDEVLCIIGYAILFFAVAFISTILTSPMRTRARELKKWGAVLERRLRAAQIQVVNALLTTLAAKDPYTMKHSRNVAFYASLIAKEIGLTHQDILQIKQACKLHDIGKVGISEKILNKPGPLEAQEWEIIKMHTIIGSEILSTVGFLEKVALMVKQEHERFDGRGYPEGLKGNEIILGAQIMSVADAFDVIASRRTYKESLCMDAALVEIEKNSGTQFNPAVVRVFKGVYEKYGRRIKKFISLSETTNTDPRDMAPVLVTQRMLKKLYG
ncbi:MAG: HD-GYP domain-containing protein [Candidatus Omnitrophica bacterium]|nr:HD-GYP domain-containing protein [Candidatus Omnitrophota bacterium]